ncbi:MAG: hypothetical protein O2779_05425 [Nanoarchaeota archaeon]|nr:hypothetical protein [Nanoarchaeota archaeon]
MIEIDEIDELLELQELLETQRLLLLNQHISTSLRKKGIKLREYRWNEVQAS